MELDDGPAEPPAPKPKRRASTRKAKPKKSASKRPAVRRRQPAPFKPTARSVATLRRKHGMSKAEFARAVGVSAVSIANWEKASGAIKPHGKGLAGLIRLHKKS